MGTLVLSFVLLVAGCGAPGATGAAAVSAGSAGKEVRRQTGQPSPKMGWPGFLYTRTSGRCTPQFWSSGREAWPKMVPEESSVSKVFGSRALEQYEPGLTLLEAVQRNDDLGGSPFSKLVRQSSAALLNAYTRQGFPHTPWEVKALFLEALVSEQAAAAQAEHFAQVNSVCP